MGQDVNFSIKVVKTSLTKEEFIKSFSNIEWVEGMDDNSWNMKNDYGYFSIYCSNEFFVFGLINIDDFSKILNDLNKIDCGFWIDLYDDDKNLKNFTSKDYWADDN